MELTTFGLMILEDNNALGTVNCVPNPELHGIILNLMKQWQIHVMLEVV
jgi:hypothetical protein